MILIVVTIVILIIYINFLKKENFQKLSIDNTISKTEKLEEGKPGRKGPLGDIGDTGPRGIPGRDSYIQGPKGYKGLRGDKGDITTGPRGIPGVKGPPGNIELPQDVILEKDKIRVNKYQVCLDDFCITERDLKIMKRKSPENCKTFHNISNNDECLSYNRERSGEKIYLSECNRTNAYQRWFYDKNNNMMRSYNNEFCLDSPYRNKNNTKVHLWSCNKNNKNQHWNFNPEISQIKNTSGKCLERNNTNLIINTCNPSNEKQKWKLF